MASKYNTTYNLSKKLNSEQIITQYDLSMKEIELMRYLYKEQYRKEDVLERFFWLWQPISKVEISKILGILKKKGLIYSVIDMAGWIGTDIKI